MEDLEDLLACPVCMELYTLKGDCVPRTFFCGHTFCHSCIKNLVRRENSVSCPTCRHNHKFSTVERLPRNFILLKLIESGYGNTQNKQKEHKPKKSYCSTCSENEPFCEKCTITSDENECKSCLKKKLLTKVSKLQNLLTEMDFVGEKFCEQNQAPIADNLTGTISDINASASVGYGNRDEIKDLCNAFITTVAENNALDATFHEQAITFFLIFHEMAEQKLLDIQNYLRADMVTCNTGGALTALSSECILHLSSLQRSKDVMLQRQSGFDEISHSLSKRQNPLRNKYAGESWERIRGMMEAYAHISRFLTRLLVVWLIASFLSDWACPVEESDKGVCWAATALASRYTIIIVTISFAAINPWNDFHSYPPPPHILFAIRKEVGKMIDMVAQNMMFNPGTTLGMPQRRYRYAY